MGALARKIEQEGIVKGKIEGKVEGIKEIALSMLAEGADLNFTSRVTKLTIDEIITLKNQNNENK